ncbi:MAG: DUF2155 domain-containing protein [Alphaproteobacteria bacterium]|nr:MAG: DUF2155 domain-containing protein [Alphaproteobacteria bacterium]
MKKWAVWGVVGISLAAGINFDAHAQLKEITEAAGKLAGRVMGKDVTPTTVSDTQALPNVGSEKSARVMLLDKQTNRRQTLVLVAGEAQVMGTVQVKLTRCIADYAATLGQDVAWLDVTESAEGSGRSAPWFSGWMFNTYPEVSTLDHPRYEVQVMGCGVKARQVVKASGSAPIVESGPISDTESGGDGDPYYVPGVGPAAVAPPAPAATEAVPAADTEAPAADTEAPAAEPAAPVAEPVAPAEAKPAAGGEQQDLHNMMDGTY